MTPYPEHDKVSALMEEEGAPVVRFLEWLRDRNYGIHQIEKGGHCRNLVWYEVDRLLCTYFEVDEQKIAEEGRAILNDLHKE